MPQLLVDLSRLDGPADQTSTENQGRGVGRRRVRRLPGLGGALGVAVVLVVWELLAVFVFEGKHIMPTPVGVLRGLWDDRVLLRENAGVTLAEAAQGWLWGNALAIVLALLFVVSPPGGGGTPAPRNSQLRDADHRYCTDP